MQSKKKCKNDFEKGFLKLMKNTIFRKTLENVRNHGNIKLVSAKARRNSLVSELNYRAAEIFSDNSLSIDIKRTWILMNKSVYLGLSILEISKIVMYEFWYDYVKPIYGENTKLCFMDTNSFIVYIKTEYIYVNIAKDIEARFDSSNYELDRPLPKRKN